MILRPPESTLTATLCPYSTLVRSGVGAAAAVLAHAAAEFGLHHHRHPADLAAGFQFAVERGQRLRQLGDLVLVVVVAGTRGALAVVGVPAAQIGRAHV